MGRKKVPCSHYVLRWNVQSHLANLENSWPNNFVCKFNLSTCTNLNQPSVLHQRPRVPFYNMGRKKVPCSHYVLRWNVQSHLSNLENRWSNNFVCKFNLFTCTNLNRPSVLHQRPRVPFYDMGRKKVPCSHYVLRWNVLLVKMMVRKLEWLSHNGIDIENCSVQ